jgi:hypothetical protein
MDNQDRADGALPANNGRRVGYRRYHGDGFRNHSQPGWVRGLPPPARGSVIIAFAILRGVVAFLINRVLAEIGLSVLAMGAKAKPSS